MLAKRKLVLPNFIYKNEWCELIQRFTILFLRREKKSNKQTINPQGSSNKTSPYTKDDEVPQSGLSQLIRFIVVELTHSGSNYTFDMNVALTANYSFSRRRHLYQQRDALGY
jgi:hypothetical protein